MLFSALATRQEPAETIVGILLSKKKISTKDAYGYFMQKHKQRMTLQGFYKILKKLIDNRIVVKESGLLSLDASWVNSLISFSYELEQKYFKQEATFSNILLEEGERKEFRFETVMDMDNFWTHALVIISRQYTQKKHEDKNGYAYTEHAWFQLLRTSQEEYLNKLYEELGIQQYHVVGSISFLDSTAVKLMNSENYHAFQIPRSPFEKNTYIMVIGDYIFETRLPSYIHEQFEVIYRNTRSLSELDMDKMSDWVRQPARTTLTISRNKRETRQLRKKIIGLCTNND